MERTCAEQALARSEEKYHALFESINEGFTTIGVIFDEAGRAVDYRFLENEPGARKDERRTAHHSGPPRARADARP